MKPPTLPATYPQPVDEAEAVPWAGDDDLRAALMAERFGGPGVLRGERVKAAYRPRKTSHRQEAD